MTDLFTDDFGSLSNDQRYSAIAAFAQAQPSESNRHDFKLIWVNDAVKSAAAFANTFGGILIIGVEKNQNDAEAKVTGFNSNTELTTGIASAIATNISPTPSYDIMGVSPAWGDKLPILRYPSSQRFSALPRHQERHFPCLGKKCRSNNSSRCRAVEGFD